MQEKPDHSPGDAREVFRAFLSLGLTSFGGPIAHLGYFRDAFVVRERWLDEGAFAELVSLCQFLPGPASSQVGFAIGWKRAGLLGGIAAWLGFTLPSALLMIAFAYGAARLQGPFAMGLIHGLKLVAVAVVAQAVLGMARTLTPDARRAAIAGIAALVVIAANAFVGQFAAIAIGALLGMAICRQTTDVSPGAPLLIVSRRTGLIAIALFAVLLGGGGVVAALSGNPIAARFDAFFRSGALVFGGGHVVLPLLQQAVVTPGWIDQNAFLAGYGAAQALPGPLFTFAAYLGAVIKPTGGWLGALVALVAIFLPGLLVLVGVIPFWQTLRSRAFARAAVNGANAAVVGVLAVALYNPIFTSAVRDDLDFAAALTGFIALVSLRAPPIAAVALGALFGVARTFIS